MAAPSLPIPTTSRVISFRCSDSPQLRGACYWSTTSQREKRGSDGGGRGASVGADAFRRRGVGSYVGALGGWRGDVVCDADSGDPCGVDFVECGVAALIGAGCY